MNSEWSLDVLYKGFDDPKFSEDLTSFEKKAKELDELSKTLSHENEKEDLLQIVKVLEEFELYGRSGYLSAHINYEKRYKAYFAVAPEDVVYIGKIKTIKEAIAYIDSNK